MITDLRRRLTIETPEGVTFSIYLAGPFTRFLAWLIDCLVLQVFLWIAVGIITSTAVVLGNVGIAVIILLYFASGFIYRIWMEWQFRGQTLGKRLLRLRVVDSSGLRLRFSQIVLRNLLRVVDAMPMFYFVGGVTTVLNRRHQRLGDVAASCVVTCLPEDGTPDFSQVLPGKYNSFRDYPHLEGRLRQQVSPQEADLVVQALLRRETLHAQERVELYRDLATHFRAKAEFPEHATLGITDEQYLRNVVDSIFRGRG
jgi:uncharacterized RDD family membrane protein YckC